MAKLSKDQCDEIKAKLSGVIGWVYLEADGYLIQAKVQQDKRNLVIAVFVDGWMKGGDFKFFKDDETENMNEVQKKFMHHEISGRSAKEIKRWEALSGKKWCKENGIYKKTIFTKPWFKTPGAFLAKIQKSCENITLLDIDTYDKKLKAKQEAANAETV
jgi:hypothetical protein